jgi:hypothetical protein
MKTGRIWVFDETRLEESLQAYQQAALEAYPNQEERIRITVAAMRDFLHSEYADPLVMGNLEN